MKSIICSLFNMFGCDTALKQDLSSCKSKLKQSENENEILSTESELVLKDLILTQTELTKLKESIKLKVFDYNFMPEEYKPIDKQLLVTDKYVYYGTNIKQDLCDLLDSSYMSREIAKGVIKNTGINKDTKIKQVFIKVYNYLITYIKYERNKVQYDQVDQWDNGDLALVTKKGDCDISSRAFIRVMKDVLYLLDINYDARNMFLVIGTFKEGGHAWVECYIEDKWYLFELTKESQVGGLHTRTTSYVPYFMHNNRDGFYVNTNWRVFL